MLKYHLLTIPQDRSFELGELFRSQGISRPSTNQRHYLRQRLTQDNYILDLVRGWEEWWTKRGNPSRESELDNRSYTPETFAAIFIPGLSRPLTLQRQLDVIKVMRSRGYRPRGNGDQRYWSRKLTRRAPTPRQLPKVHAPRYIKFPVGAFSIREFLAHNGMRLFRENFVWAREQLRIKGATKLVRPNGKWAVPDRRGKIRASIMCNWEIPGEAFTTAQFQALNHCRQPSADEWRSAVEFLTHSGYKYDPKWRRWLRQAQ